MRKICVVTGTRADYGILRPVIEKINQDADLRLQLVATGMHTLKKFSSTYKLIEKDGFTIDFLAKVDMGKESKSSMALTVSKSIEEMVKAYANLKPDIVLVLGDRSEILGSVIAAAYQNIPVAHIHGGDNALGGFDELARGAITKLSHIHFPATKKSEQRILKLGEQKWRVHMVGSPAIDSIKTARLPTKKQLFSCLGLDQDKKTFLILQHPVTTEPDLAQKQIKDIMGAVSAFDAQYLVIYPNSDFGGRKITEVIDSYTKKDQRFKTVANLEHSQFLALMKYCDLMIGNSSSAIIEAPYFKTAAINIGIRQKGRESSSNIIECENNPVMISKSIKKALSAQFQNSLKYCVNLYGDGKSTERILKVLKNIRVDKKLLKKPMMSE